MINKIGYTYGAFDGLTMDRLYEIIKFLENHKEIVIGIYSDELLSKIYANEEPIFNFEQRTAVLESLKGVKATFKVDSLDKQQIEADAIEAYKKSLIKNIDKANKKEFDLGYISGVFDLCHPGHIEHLLLAKEKCEKLVVGVKTDKFVQKNKNKTPVVPEQVRLEIIKHLKFVDDAYLTDEICEPPENVSKIYGDFDALFLGSDWSREEKLTPEKKQYLEFLRSKYNLQFSKRTREQEKKVSSTSFTKRVKKQKYAKYPEKPLEIDDIEH